MVTGAVTITPGISFQVCDGDQLELICTVNDSESNVLEWTFAPATIFMGQHRAIENMGDQTFSIITINSTKFTFSRISAQKESPLVSRLLIIPVTAGLNETVVNCTDVIAMETASAIVYVLNRLTDSMSC